MRFGALGSGVVIFRLHWTVFVDDFYLVASLDESKHVDMAQKLFFQLIGWQVGERGGLWSSGQNPGYPDRLERVHPGFLHNMQCGIAGEGLGLHHR